MPNPMIKIYDIESDTTVEREMTDAEFIQYKIGNETKKINDLESLNKRQALLDKLGITEDEARLLLGGN